MKKKWWFAIAAIFALAVVLAIALPALLPPTPGVTYANYSRLESGMTRAEVETLLGKPNFEVGEFEIIFVPQNDHPLGHSTHWRGEDGDIVTIRFDGKESVLFMTWNGQHDERTGLEKLRDRIPFLAKRPPSPLVTVL